MEENNLTAEEEEIFQNVKQQLEKAQTYLNSAKEKMMAAHFEEALELCEKAKEIYLDNSNETLVIDALNLYWNILLVRDGKNADGEGMQKHLNHVEEKLGKTNEYYEYMLSGMGNYHIQLNQYNTALKFYKESLKLCLELHGPYHYRTYRAFTEIAYTYIQKSFIKEAEKYYKKALQNIEVNGDDFIGIGTIYGGLAWIYWHRGDIDQQLYYSHKSLEFRKRIYGQNHRNTSYGYYTLGACYKGRKEYSKALEFLFFALEIREQNYPENNPEISVCQGFIAQIFFEMQNYEKSIEYTKKVLSNSNIAKRIKGDNILLLGSNFFAQGKYTESFDLMTQGLSIYQEIYDSQHIEMARVNCELGKCHLAQERYSKAIASQKTALQILNCTSNTIEKLSFTKKNKSIVVLQAFGDALYKRYRFHNQELTDLEESLSSLELASKLIDRMRQSYRTEASKLMLSNSTTKIFESAVSVSALLSTVSDSVFSEKSFDFSEKTKAILLLQNQQDLEAKTAINISETLLQKEKQLKIELTYLEKSIQKEEAKGDKKDEELIQKWQNEFFNFHQEYIQLLQQLETDYPDYYQLKYDTKTVTPTELQSILQENQAVISYFVGGEKLYIFAVTPDEFEVIDLQLPTDFEALIQDFMDALTQHQFAAFTEKSHQLHQLLIAPIRDFIVDDFAFDDEELKQVFVIPHGVLSYVPFEALIGSPPQPLARREAVAKVLARTENSPTLAEFGDVWSGLDYLINHCEISYHYSATLLHRHLLKKQSEEEIPNSFAGFAPIYDTNSPSQSSKSISSNKNVDALQESAKAMQVWATRSDAIRSDGTWVSLPHSETEIKGIAQFFEEKGLKAETFLREKASKEGFLEAAKRFKFLLVAAHGLVNDEKTALSGLVFYPSKGREKWEEGNKTKEKSGVKNSPLFEKNGDIWNDDTRQMLPSLPDVGESTTTDSVLSMEETHQLDLQADLVVLSSCESGIGTLHKGEGMMAVNRGFLAAGANNVVSTLFKVYDKPSSLLTQYLFEAILEGEEYAAALRLAKLKLMKQPNIDPKSWSGFVLIGG